MGNDNCSTCNVADGKENLRTMAASHMQESKAKTA